MLNLRGRIVLFCFERSADTSNCTIRLKSMLKQIQIQPRRITGNQIETNVFRKCRNSVCMWENHKNAQRLPNESRPIIELCSCFQSLSYSWNSNAYTRSFQLLATQYLKFRKQGIGSKVRPTSDKGTYTRMFFTSKDIVMSSLSWPFSLIKEPSSLNSGLSPYPSRLSVSLSDSLRDLCWETWLG